MALKLAGAPPNYTHPCEITARQQPSEHHGPDTYLYSISAVPDAHAKGVHEDVYFVRASDSSCGIDIRSARDGEMEGQLAERLYNAEDRLPEFEGRPIKILINFPAVNVAEFILEPLPDGTVEKFHLCIEICGMISDWLEFFESNSRAQMPGIGNPKVFSTFHPRTNELWSRIGGLSPGSSVLWDRLRFGGLRYVRKDTWAVILDLMLGPPGTNGPWRIPQGAAFVYECMACGTRTASLRALRTHQASECALLPGSSAYDARWERIQKRWRCCACNVLVPADQGMVAHHNTQTCRCTPGSIAFDADYRMLLARARSIKPDAAHFECSFCQTVLSSLATFEAHDARCTRNPYAKPPRDTLKAIETQTPVSVPPSLVRPLRPIQSGVGSPTSHQSPPGTAPAFKCPWCTSVQLSESAMDAHIRKYCLMCPGSQRFDRTAMVGENGRVTVACERCHKRMYAMRHITPHREKCRGPQSSYASGRLRGDTHSPASTLDGSLSEDRW